MPTVTFTLANQSELESVGTMTITAQLSAISISNVTVPFTLLGGTATEGGGNDYTITATPITITAGNLSEDITITVNDDGLIEADETVIVTMGVPTNAIPAAPTVHAATIQDNDLPPTVAFTVASQSGQENIIGTMTITAQLSALSGLDVTVPFTLGGTATEGAAADYTITASPVTITAGNLSADITITVNDDGLAEGDETVIVTMGVPTNATQGAITTHTATIQDDEKGFETDISSVSVAEGGTATFSVRLTSDPGVMVTVGVALVSGDSDISVTAGDTLVFTPLNWSDYQEVELTAAEDADTENGVAVIRCSSPGFVDLDVTATEQDDGGDGATHHAGGCFLSTAHATGSRR